MQSQQQEKLKRMIGNSSMLSKQEKEEWLDMLIVMNDKQVSELETILNTPSEEPKPKPVPAPTPVVPKPAPMPIPPMPKATPPMSHISNLPSSFIPIKYPLPKKVKPSANLLKQWEEKLRRTVEEKELKSGGETKSLPSLVKQVPPVPRVVPQQQRVTAPRPVQSHIHIDMPTPIPRASIPAPTPAPAAPAPAPVLARKTEETSRPPLKQELPAELKKVEDIGNLNLATMRFMGANLVPALKQFVASSNYFQVLFFIEKSPLYKAYIDTGHEALNVAEAGFPASSGDKTRLSKEEFEAFSDLLKSIQIS